MSKAAAQLCTTGCFLIRPSALEVSSAVGKAVVFRKIPSPCSASGLVFSEG